MTSAIDRAVHLRVVAYLDGVEFRGWRNEPYSGIHYKELSAIDKQLYEEYFIKGRDNKSI